MLSSFSLFVSLLKASARSNFLILVKCMLMLCQISLLIGPARLSAAFCKRKHTSVPWVRAIPSTNTGWVENTLRAALSRNIKTVRSRLWEVILPLCSTLVRPHQQHCEYFLRPGHISHSNWKIKL